MALNILRLSQLFVYLIITSQLLFYLFILSDALKHVSLDNFIELRKIIDLTMGHRFKISYYLGLALTLAVVVSSAKHPGSMIFISSAIALVCLVADVTIAMKGNVPINMIFNHYRAGETLQNGNDLRLQWLALINARGIITVTGMVTQLAALVWKH